MTYVQAAYLITIIYCLVVVIEMLTLIRVVEQGVFWVILGLTTVGLIWAIEYLGKMYAVDR